MDRPLLLIVEDERLLHLFIEDALDGAGFAAVFSADAKTAVAELDQDVARFAGLVTDIRLGSILSGWDVARYARKLQPALPVVYITGDSAHEWSAEGVPGSLVLTKPFAEAQLVTAVAQLLNVPPLT
ncbi:response regulator [Rhizobium sp. YIM 134829]|uniref:response regulator n=1 Tax=Rhizobium sp. YIM 134829 TaxID=3390453 RepID=UPI00397D8229